MDQVRIACTSRIAICLILGLTLSPVSAALARGESVVYEFKGPSDGYEPLASLTLSRAGEFVGTTYLGGGTGCSGGCGTIFELTPKGKETVLHAFSGGGDGANPYAGLIETDDATFFGTTYSGGTGCKGEGCGTVFEFRPRGGETVVYAFKGGTDGSNPHADLVVWEKGNLYGTTKYGGAYGFGTVFKITAQGREKVIYSFRGGADGAYPLARLVAVSGSLFGTTAYGGAGCGGNGCGTAFRLGKDGSESTMYNFCSKAYCADGYYPYAGLTSDSSGNLYGTTVYGGADGYGTVFKLDGQGTETTLYTFTGGLDGANPTAELIVGASGDVYGTTVGGGLPHCFSYGCGTVFRVDQYGVEKVIHAFTGPGDGAYPYARLIRGGAAISSVRRRRAAIATAGLLPVAALSSS